MIALATGWQGKLASVVLLACAWLAIEKSAHSAEPARPNVVVILIDDLGWADLGCYGSKFHRTPNLDRLAAEGMRFTHAYAACPVCSPTRAALLTGKYPARLHLTDYIPGQDKSNESKLLRPDFLQQLPLEETTLAEMLKGVGYATAAIGKWHLGGKGSEPQRHGFDVAVGGNDWGSVKNHFAPFASKTGPLPGLADATPGDYIADRLTTEAEKFIEQNAKRPFFLYLSHYAVHTPLQAPPDLVAKYKNAAPHGQQRNPVFAAMVENMDASVGRVMQKLADLELTENTLLVFTSDNGGLATSGQPTDLPATCNAPLREGKGYLYEGGTRVAFIARWPARIAAGSTCSVPTSSIDLLPTVAAACDVSVTQPIDGLSILPLLEGKTQLERDTLFWHYPHYSPQGGRPGSSIRERDFKLIEFYENGRRELFDVVHDPSESRNLSEEKPQLVERLAARLNAWRAEVDAHAPTPNPNYKPDTQAADGSVTLPAENAEVHGVMLRYEPLPHKDTLGFWVRTDDWAEWQFNVDKPGRFRVELLQGCGTGSGGSEVEVKVANSSAQIEPLKMTVEETGGFQQFVPREIGEITLDKPGRYTLSVKVLSKPHAAVMDLRRVRLIPAGK